MARRIQPEPQPLAQRTRRRLNLFLVALNLLLLLVLLLMVWWMIAMPGRSFSGALPALDKREAKYEKLLREAVGAVAGDIGERNVYRKGSLERTAGMLSSYLGDMGYVVRTEPFPVGGGKAVNLIAEKRGKTKAEEIVLVGAHYDTVQGSPGADDNGSGVAALLALANSWANRTPGRTVRFVLFANEEAPFFQGDSMGSAVHAKAAQARGEKIVAMLSLETMGFYTDAPDSQRYPRPLNLFYPSTGNFLAFVGNLKSRQLVRDAITRFRETAHLPSEGASLPDGMPGVGWSDHSSFWKIGVPALMVTDTALFRNPHYHAASDTPDTLDFPRFARAVAGVEDVVELLANR